MSDALEEHDGKVSIGGRNITNLQFADDIDALAEEEHFKLFVISLVFSALISILYLEALVEGLEKTCTRYKMDISARRPN